MMKYIYLLLFCGIPKIVIAEALIVGDVMLLTKNLDSVEVMYDRGSNISLVKDKHGNAVEVQTSKEFKTQFGLFQLDCELLPCTAWGKFIFNYNYMVPQLTFVFNYYNKTSNGNGKSIQHYLDKFNEIEVSMMGFANYGEDVYSLVLIKDPSRFSSEKIEVILDELSEEKIKNFVKECFHSCEELIVEGKLLLKPGIGFVANEYVLKATEIFTQN